MPPPDATADPADDPLADLSFGARRLLEAVRSAANEQVPGTAQWLLVLLEHHAPMVEALRAGTDVRDWGARLRAEVAAGRPGPPLPVEEVLRRSRARHEGASQARVTEQDLARVLLAAAEDAMASPPAGPPRPAPPAGGADGPAAAPTPARPGDGPPPASVPRPRVATPTLEKLGRNLTELAEQGRLPRLVGREAEVELIVETLCRKTKRNPLLVGPAGVGKTAVVEGLATRVARGEVPALLRGVRIFELRPSVIVASIRSGPEFMEAMEKIIREASQDGVILFFDEAHAIVGVGGAPGATDMSGLLKPALARGDVAVIGATTEQEHRAFIQRDGALERRFQPIRIHELTPEQTLEVLEVHARRLEGDRGVVTPVEVRRQLVDFAGRLMRNRRFPDKAVDLLEQCVAHVVARGGTEVTREDAAHVVERMTGMPLTPSDRLQRLDAALEENGLLPGEERQALMARLRVTFSGLDVHDERPNAVALLLGHAAGHAEPLAATIAAALFGASNRIVAVDLSRFQSEHDVAGLIGSPPGYVGYGDPGPLHPLVQAPSCVLLLRNLDLCHPRVREVLRVAFAEGRMSTGSGERIFLSEAVVLLTAHAPDAPSTGRLGFGHTEEAAPEDAFDLAGRFGEPFAQEVDLVLRGASRAGGDGERWVREVLLAGLARRLESQGVRVEWDDSLVAWLLEQRALSHNERELERLVDESVGIRIFDVVSSATPGDGATLRVRYRDGEVVVTAQGP